MNAILRRIPKPAQAILLVLTLGILVLELWYVIKTQSSWTNPITSFGTRDLIAFWAGTQTFLRGSDPYTGAHVLALQRQIAPEMLSPQVFLNPPWALLPFSILFALPFLITRALWFILNLCCLLTLSSIVYRSLPAECRASRLSIALGSLLFFPTIYNLWMGQLSLVVCTALALSLISIARNKALLAALPGCIVIWKPHLLLPLLFVAALYLIRHKMKSVFVYSALVGVTCVGFPLLWDAAIYQNWMKMDFSPLAYQTATFVALARLAVESTTGVAMKWPAVVIPLLATLTSALVFIRSKGESRYSATSIFLLIALSLTFAPYAWPYDFVLLLPVQLVSLALLSHSALSDRARAQGWIALYAPQALYLLQGTFITSLGAGCWFPAALFLSWLYIRKLLLGNAKHCTLGRLRL